MHIYKLSQTKNYNKMKP